MPVAGECKQEAGRDALVVNLVVEVDLPVAGGQDVNAGTLKSTAQETGHRLPVVERHRVAEDDMVGMRAVC